MSKPNEPLPVPTLVEHNQETLHVKVGLKVIGVFTGPDRAQQAQHFMSLYKPSDRFGGQDGKN